MEARTKPGATDGRGDVRLEQAPVTPVARLERRRPPRALQRSHAERARDATADVLARELTRSRRYARPLTVIGIVYDSTRGGARTATVALRNRVRTVDCVWEGPAGVVFVLLPESHRGDGQALLERLRAEAPETLDGAAAYVASFPADALTAGALLEVAQGRAAPALVEPPRAAAHSLGRSAPGGPAVSAERTA